MTAQDFDNCPFQIGQPIWVRPGLFCKEDPRTFIVIDMMRGFFGGLMAEVVPEDNLRAAHEYIPVKYLTDQMPPFLMPHPEHEGRPHWTATGRIVVSIRGGRHAA